MNKKKVLIYTNKGTRNSEFFRVIEDGLPSYSNFTDIADYKITSEGLKQATEESNDYDIFLQIKFSSADKNYKDTNRSELSAYSQESKAFRDIFAREWCIGVIPDDFLSLNGYYITYDPDTHTISYQDGEAYIESIETGEVEQVVRKDCIFNSQAGISLIWVPFIYFKVKYNDVLIEEYMKNAIVIFDPLVETIKQYYDDI